VTNIVSVAAGTEHSIALRADGAMILWGELNLTQATPTIAAMAGGEG
jgi:hypothetical protein